MIERAAIIRAMIDGHQSDYSFTDGVSSPDGNVGDIDVCLLAFGTTNISHIALVERRGKILTAKYRVLFSIFTQIEPPLTVEEIERAGVANVGAYIIRASRGSGARVPARTWAALIAAIKTLRPNIASDLDHLAVLRRDRRLRHTARGFEIMAQEKDAAGLAVEIFGGDRQSFFAGWTTRSSRDSPVREVEPLPFLQGLTEAVLPEDVMIAHDHSVFGGVVGSC